MNVFIVQISTVKNYKEQKKNSKQILRNLGVKI